MIISINVSAEEEALFRAYAKSRNMNVSEMIRRFAKERIEDELDTKECLNYLKEKEIGTVATIAAKDVFKDAGT